MNCCNNFLYKTQKGREIKEKLELSKMNHILKTISQRYMMHVQEVESTLFTKYLERLMDDMKIKTARQNSINATSVGLCCISIDRSIGLPR